MTNTDKRASAANRYEFAATLDELRPRSIAVPSFLLKLRPVIAFALVALVVAVLAFKIVSTPNPGPAIDERSDAFYSAQQFVSSKLKAPATARFCAKSDAAVSRNGKQTIVSGYVDSSNSFGAVIRSRWTVAINADGSLADVKIR